MAPRVSVCIPTYNGREHLKECIDSVRAQSFEDFEAVLCDDQSQDGTLDLARELTRGDGRFRFIQNPRRLGLVGNWNRCVEVSRGGWIKFVFQDDLISPTCVEALLNACERTGKPFAFCRRHVEFAPGTPETVCDFFAEHDALMDRLYSTARVVEAKDFVRWSLEHRHLNLVGEPTCTLLSRRLFADFGKFDPALIQLCDGEFWRRIGGNTGIAVVPERLATYRVHNESATAANGRERAFRMEVVEPCVQDYHLLFDRHYRPFRSAPPVPATLARRRIQFSRQSGRVRRLTLSRCPADWRQIAKVHPVLMILAWAGSAANWLVRSFHPDPRRQFHD